MSPLDGSFDLVAVRAALATVIATLDYDLHKQIECDESTGEDTYPAYVELFVDTYRQQLAA